MTITKKELLEECLKATKLFTEYNEYTISKKETKKEEKKSPQQDKINSIMQVINNGFGCEKENVKNLVIAITGLDLPKVNDTVQDDGLAFKKFACFVLTANYDEHNYPLNDVCMALSNNTCDHLQPYSTVGNDLSLCKRVTRPATKDEIIYYVNSYYTTILKYI